MNIPAKQTEIPENAKGNPIYEQTREDMPLWCCGKNCGRNSRVVVLVFSCIGLACSIWACLAVDYFSFVAIRNDTFYDEDKRQPSPFEYAVEADVGLFKYRILEAYEYPWPPSKFVKEEEDDDEGERALFEKMLLEELRRLQAEDGDAANTTAETLEPADVSNVTLPPMSDEDEAAAAGNATDGSGGKFSNGTIQDAPPPGPGSFEKSNGPTESPTAAPTITNPNIDVNETVQIGVVKRYPEGVGQFDSTFTNAQRGGILGPVFAALGTFFGLIELCCCTYKCSWLPTALFLYLAFMFQLFTLFLFMSEDFCKYAQECALGIGGVMTSIAVICYFFAQSLVCCSPRPEPCFKCCKKSPIRRKKKKKKNPNNEDDPDGDRRAPYRDYDDGDFQDEPEDDSAYVDPYDEGSSDEDDDGEYDMYDSSYADQRSEDEYEDDQETNDNSGTYYDDGGDTHGGDTYGDGTYTDDAEGEDENGSGWSTGDDYTSDNYTSDDYSKPNKR